MAERKQLTIVAFGDSITACNTETPDDSMRWPVMMEKALRATFPSMTITVINAGVGGNTSREGLARMEADVLAHEPDYVLVEFGGNDATPEPDRHVSLDEYRRNLRTMKSRLEARGCTGMIPVTFPPIINERHTWRDGSFGPGGPDGCVEQYRQVTREFAAEHRLPLADMDQAIRPDRECCILPDGVHLTAKGNRTTADLMIGVMEPIVKAGRH